MAPREFDPKFKNAGKKPGLQIWRINKFDLEEVPKEQFGNFYEGDSYIVLHTKNSDSFDAHFWLGKKTTTDEMGTAAIKTVELDDALGGLPVQYREVQDHESALFFSCFKQGIKYLEGGYETGFNRVGSALENFKPRLFHCKGSRNVRCTQVKVVKESLNLGDVFIFDKGTDLYVWMPPESGRIERLKGVQQAEAIRDQERAGKAKIHVLDHEWNTNFDFWKHFGGKESVGWIKAPRGGGHDDEYELQRKSEVQLFKCSDASGKLEISKISQGAIDAKSLDPNDAFIVDAGLGGIFVWVGKGCTMQERSKAMGWAQEYLQKAKRPSYTQVTRVLDSAEPENFTQWFSNWSAIKKPVQHKVHLFQVSNESGKMHVEEIADFYQEDLDGDDVMLLDAVNQIYVWVGAGANKDERDHAQSTAEKYLKGSAVPRHKNTKIEIQFQSKESPTFKRYFPEWDDKLFQGNERNYKNMRNLLFQ